MHLYRWAELILVRIWTCSANILFICILPSGIISMKKIKKWDISSFESIFTFTAIYIHDISFWFIDSVKEISARNSRFILSVQISHYLRMRLLGLHTTTAICCTGKGNQGPSCPLLCSCWFFPSYSSLEVEPLVSFPTKKWTTPVWESWVKCMQKSVLAWSQVLLPLFDLLSLYPWGGWSCPTSYWPFPTIPIS